MNWASALYLDFQENVYSKKKKKDVLDFPGWIIKSICFFHQPCGVVKLEHFIN